MFAIERRQYILETLSDRRSISVGNLAKECNVSIRTIKYDIESLSSSVQILTVPGPGGGIRVADGWYLIRRYLREDQEAKQKKHPLTGVPKSVPNMLFFRFAGVALGGPVCEDDSLHQ